MPESASIGNLPSPALPLLVALPALLFDFRVFLGVRAGRDVFLARAGDLSAAAGFAGLVLLLLGLLGHVVLAVMRSRTLAPSDANGHNSPGNRRLQQASAVLVLVFLVVRVRHSVFLSAVEGVGAGGLYERIRSDCDGYLFLAVYVLGLAALSVHASQGVNALLSRARFAEASTRRVLGYGSVLLVLAGAAFIIDALSAYTAGAPLLSSFPTAP